MKKNLHRLYQHGSQPMSIQNLQMLYYNLNSLFLFQPVQFLVVTNVQFRVILKCSKTLSKLNLKLNKGNKTVKCKLS